MIFSQETPFSKKAALVLREARIADRSEKEAPAASRERLLKASGKLVELLPSAKEASSLTDAISKLVKESIRLNVDKERIRLLATSEEATPSRATYPILDTKKEKELLFVHAYAEPYGELLTDLGGASIFDSLALSKLAIPSYRGIARYTIKERTFVLVAQSTPAGTSLSQLRKELSVEEFGAVLGKLGGALAELHASQQSEERVLDERRIEKMRRSASQTVKKLGPKPTAKQLAAHCEKLLKAIEKQKTTYTASYGHFGFINLFYDQKSERFWQAEPSGFFDALDLSDEPRGLAAEDLYSIIRAIDRLVERDFSSKELSLLKKAFEKGYKEAGGSLPKKIWLVWSQTQFALTYFLQTGNFILNLDA